MSDLYQRYHAALALAGLLAGLVLGLVNVRTADSGDGPLVGLGCTLTVLGVWASVPDTEVAAAMVGLSLGMAATARPKVSLPRPWMLIPMWLAMVVQGSACLTSAWIASIGAFGVLPSLWVTRSRLTRAGSSCTSYLLLPRPDSSVTSIH